MANEICLIAPYEQLTEAASAVARDCGQPFDVEVANLEAAIPLLPRLEARGYQVLVSRGKTAELLRQHTSLPVIDIKTSSYDVLRVLSDLIGRPVRLGFVGHHSVVRNCKKVADMLNIRSDSILFDQSEPLQYESLREHVREHFADNPIDLMIGDTIPQSHFGNLCGEFRLISSGREALQEAIESAAAFLTVLKRETVNRHHLSTVLDMFEKVVFSLDRNGLITHANQAAARVFQVSRAEMMGKPIEAIDPALAVARDTIANGVWEVGRVVETRQGRMVSYQYPIESDGECHSIVFALERVERIYTIEQKVRHQEEQQQGGRFAAQYHFDDYVTHDPVMQARLKELDSYARTDATLLIIGESGTGKELLAQGAHNASRRAKQPFVAINCGALPPTLLESELFGYVDGAFTGASRKGKRGLFELAHKGTLFLDEIGELDKSLQTRLLRVVQERQLMRLGSEEVIPVDIRIIAATNQDLEAMVAEGSFRRDLFYRLNVLKFEAPPLRERRQDIIPSALALLRRHARHYKRHVVDIDMDLRRFLLDHDWPGNLRELGNIMERIAIIAPDEVAGLASVASALTDLQKKGARTAAKCTACDITEGNMDSIRQRIVRRVMAEEGNSKSQAARRLGIDRGTLNRWLKEETPR